LALAPAARAGGEDCTDAGLVEAAALPMVVDLDTSGARDDATSTCALQAGGPDLVFAILLTAPKSLRLVLAPESGFDAMLYVRAGSCGDPLAEIACADRMPPGGAEVLLLPGLPPGAYFVFADGVTASDRGRAELAFGEVLPVSAASWGAAKARFGAAR
jgi:hypothetical protein